MGEQDAYYVRPANLSTYSCDLYDVVCSFFHYQCEKEMMLVAAYWIVWFVSPSNVYDCVFDTNGSTLMDDEEIMLGQRHES